MMGKCRALLNMVGCAVLVVIATSCASIVKAGSQEVSIHSRPDTAQIKVFNKKGEEVKRGTTPVTLKLKRGAGFFSPAKYRVQVAKAGYATQTIDVTGKVNGWYLGGNLIFGGLLGYLIVDPATGGMWTLSPDDVSAELAAQHGGIWRNNNGFTVVLKAEVPEICLARMKPVVLD